MQGTYAIDKTKQKPVILYFLHVYSLVRKVCLFIPLICLFNNNRFSLQKTDPMPIQKYHNGCWEDFTHLWGSDKKRFVG